MERLEALCLMTAAYTPAQIYQAYGLAQLNPAGGSNNLTGAGTTIAIIDPYDDPSIANDLKVFDQQYGLPDPSFTKEGQGGSGSALPKPASSTSNPAQYTNETALDVEWAHAIAPGAAILLVEPNSGSDSDILAAVDTARNTAGVVAVSLSIQNAEFSNQADFAGYFTTPANHAGVEFLASTGDTGGGAQWPSSYSTVIAVGGTSLQLDANNNIASETVWNFPSPTPPGSDEAGGSTNGGSSLYDSIPTAQLVGTGLTSGKRGVPDVAYNAGFGVSVYDSNYTASPWLGAGGTSAGTPQWAGLIALADQGRAQQGKAPLQGLDAIYDLPRADFNDITSGNTSGGPPVKDSSGNTTQPPKIYASVGYDLASGLGSPIANLLVPGLIAEANTVADETAIYTYDSSAQNGSWYVHATDGSTYTLAAPTNWHVLSSDIAIAGNFDGGGMTELGVYRPSTSTFYIIKTYNRSGPLTNYAVQFGPNGSADIPVVGDFFGDGHSDLGVYVQNSANWYFARSWAENIATGNDAKSAYGGINTYALSFGDNSSTKLPVPARYDASIGHDQVAYFVPASGTWYIATSMSSMSSTGSTSYTWQVTGGYVVNFGNSSFLPVPANYNTTGHAELAVFKPSTGNWYVASSWPETGTPSNPAYTTAAATSVIHYGDAGGDSPIPGYFDGVGHVDLAYYNIASGSISVATSFPTGGTESSPAAVDRTSTFSLMNNPANGVPLIGTYDIGGNGDTYTNGTGASQSGAAAPAAVATSSSGGSAVAVPPPTMAEATETPLVPAVPVATSPPAAGPPAPTPTFRIPGRAAEGTATTGTAVRVAAPRGPRVAARTFFGHGSRKTARWFSA